MGTKGRFKLGSDGRLVQVHPAQAPPDGAHRPEGPDPVQGPTRIGEWMLVDVRVAKLVDPKSELYSVCQELSRRGACGVVESTLVIDLLEAKAPARAVVLDRANWPEVKR